MTEDEKRIYSLTLFGIGDEVWIGESKTLGTITGVKICEGSEDLYRVLYYADDNPHESWWRGSLLSSADDMGGPESNIVPFPCACERQVRKQTRH